MDEFEPKPGLTGIQKFTLFSGVIMPVISITVESTSHICAETFFDPIPTPWHVALVIFVPLAQLHVWFVVRRGAITRPALTGLVNAMAIAVSLFYTIVYIPILPLAAMTLLLIIGILPLAPLLSLVASMVMRVQLKHVSSATAQKSFALKNAGLFAGFGISALLIGAIELPGALTRYGLGMAASADPVTRSKGIQFLRTFGSRDHLLRACYSRTGLATELFGFFWVFHDPVSPGDAQKIFYRVTGETFNTSAPPRRTNGRLDPAGEFDFDRDLGGVQVGGKLRGLSLSSSKLDGSVDANGGVGYMQWTLLFLNESIGQREARAEIQLPPGAVVSRLTLWVNGEEREAAFAGKGKVRQAYESVVRQRRDPVLVTTAGRDRILVQCFPVPPDRGEMKIRLGITVPLLLEDEKNVQLLLPHFVNRNFRIPNDLTHSIWMESKSPMTSDNSSLKFTRFSANTFALGGGISDLELSVPPNSIKLTRADVMSWSKDPFEIGRFVVQQTIVNRVPSHLYRIVLVVDTSKDMEGEAANIREALRSIPADFDVQLVLANGDDLQNVTAAGLDQISARLSDADFGGGADNAPALLKAWDLAAEKPGNNAIVWIHAPQRLQLHSIEELRQRWERRSYGPTLFNFRTASGSDEIERHLDGISEVKSVPRMFQTQADLEKLFSRLTGQTKTLEFVRINRWVEQNADPNDVATQTSDHLARLWANDEVTRILNARDESLNDEAVMLASRYQLVTPVTGAVVLETAQQYSASGLTPVDPGTVPTIPEPEIVVLLIVTAIFLGWVAWRKYRATNRGGCTV